MKLAEALMKRRDILKKIKGLEEEVETLLFTSDKEEIEIRNTRCLDKLQEIYKLAHVLYILNVTIDGANLEIQDKIRSIQKCDKLIHTYKNVRKKLLDGDTILGYREVSQRYPVIDVDEINTMIENAEEKRRNYDKEIQKYNWSKELDIDM